MEEGKKIVDTPVNADLEHAISGNWAYDHVADASAHHPAVVAEGRPYYGTTYGLSLPGVSPQGVGLVAWLSDRIYYAPIYVVTPITIDRMVIEVSSATSAGKKLRAAIYDADVNWQPVAQKVASAEIALDAVAVVTTAITATTLTAGRYLIAWTIQENVSLRAVRYDSRYSGYIGTFGASAMFYEWYVTAAYAALPASGTAWDTVLTTSQGMYYPILLRVLTP